MIVPLATLTEVLECVRSRRGSGANVHEASTGVVGRRSASTVGISAAVSEVVREIVVANENSSGWLLDPVRVRACERTANTVPPSESGKFAVPTGVRGPSGWRSASVHATECTQLLGHDECAGRLVAATTASEGLDAAVQTETAARSVVAAARAMRERGCPSRHVRLLEEAADLARRAALEARIECLLALAAGKR